MYHYCFVLFKNLVAFDVALASFKVAVFVLDLAFITAIDLNNLNCCLSIIHCQYHLICCSFINYSDLILVVV